MNRTSPLIAVVDDEESVRKALERLIRSAGMHVKTFQSGAEFLDAGLTLSIDCVIIDVLMSEMNGLDVQTQMVNTGKLLPVIMMTGHDMPGWGARARGDGAVAYLLKPIDERILFDAIESVVSLKNS